MNPSQFLVELRYRFTAQEWPNVLLALLHDELVWKSVTGTELGVRALEKLPAKPAYWNPAALAFLDEGLDIDSLALQRGEGTTIQGELLQKAQQAYSDWGAEGVAVKRVGQAGLVALSLWHHGVEQGDWSGLITGFDLDREHAGTVLSCLMAIVPQPEALLKTWLNGRKNANSIILHALLSNPFNAEKLGEYLRTLVADLSLGEALGVFKELHLFRPWLLCDLADFYLQLYSQWMEKFSEDSAFPSAADQAYLDELLGLVEVSDFAHQHTKSIALLNKGLQLTRHLQGVLSARLANSAAQIVTDSQHERQKVMETIHQAWEKAVELAPENPSFQAGILRLKIDSGEGQEARTILENWLSENEHIPDASVSLLNAKFAFQEGDIERAFSAALDALEKFEAGSPLDCDEIIELAKLLLAANEYHAVVRIGEIARSRFIELKAEMLGLLAEALLGMGHPFKALTHAYTAVATHGNAGGNPLPLDLRRLLVRCLEAAEVWDAALDERTQMLDEKLNADNEDWLALAECALKAGEIDQSLNAIQKVLDAGVENQRTRYILGEIHLRNGDVSKALEYLRRVIREDPTLVDAWLAMAKAYHDAGEGEEGIEVLRKAAQAVPGEAKIHLALGRMYRENNALTQALASFRQAAEFSDESSVMLPLGETLYRLGHYSEARAVLENALRIAGGSGSIPMGEPQAEEIARVYANVLIALGEYAVALDVLEPLHQSHPQDLEINKSYFQSLLKTADPLRIREQAIPKLEDIVAQQGAQLNSAGETSASEIDEFNLLLAEAFAAIGDWRRAMQAYQSSMESVARDNPDERVRLALGFGRASIRLEQPEAAIAVLKETLELVPDDVSLWQMLSAAYLKSNLTADAFHAAIEARQLAPNDLENLVWFIEQVRVIQENAPKSDAQMEEEIESSLRHAVAISPKRVDLIAQLLRILLDRGEDASAREVIRKLDLRKLEFQGISIDDLFALGNALRQFGEPEHAVALFEKAISRLVQDPETNADGDQLADGYAELALAYTQCQKYQEALAAVNKSLDVKPQLVEALFIKAEVLQALQQEDEALMLLRQVSRLSGDNPEVLFRGAQLLYQCGSPAEALRLVEQGVVLAENAMQSNLAQNGRLLAAQLAYSLLLPGKAEDYLGEGEGARLSPVENLLPGLCIQAEIGLEKGIAATYEDALHAYAQSYNDDDVHLISLLSRLALRSGKQEDALKLYEDAVQLAGRLGEDATQPVLGGISLEKLWKYLALARTANELGKWEQAYEWADMGRQQVPWAPLAHFQFAQISVLQAECQRVCEDIKISVHAPGLQVLSENRYQAFKTSLQSASQLLRRYSSSYPSATSEFQSAMRELQEWEARGEVAFRVETTSIRILEKHLLEGATKPENIAALLMGYRRRGELDSAENLVDEIWENETDFAGLRNLTVILFQVCLTLNARSPQKSLQVALELFNAGKSGMNNPPIPPNWIRALIAICAFQAGALELASNSIQEALAEWPEEPGWHALAGEICYQLDPQGSLKEDSKAIVHLEQAAQLEPSSASHHIALGRIYLEMEDLPRARNAYEKATRLDPENPQPWLALAKMHAAAGEWKRAAECVEKAIKASPQQEDALLLRGEIALQSGDAQAALDQAVKMLREDPLDTSAKLLKARALESLGQMGEALSVLSAAANAQKDNLEIHLERVKMIRRMKGLEEGLVALQELVQDYETHPTLLALLADWLLEAGKQEAAIQVARSLLQDSRRTLSGEYRAQLHYLIGSQMIKEGQLDQAIHHLSEAVQQAPQHIDAYLSLGKAYLNRRDNQQALKVFRKAISLAADDYRPYYQAGVALKDAKEYPEAEMMLRKAAQLAPDEVRVHRLLAAVVALNFVHNRKFESSEANA